MNGFSSGSVLLVNAEVDSMGGVVEGGVGLVNRTSPRRAVIEKVQAELRQEYDVLEERRRELEFLEKGGNPLDFKLGNAASLSVQSTSLTDQHPDQFVTSEAKGSFAVTASPHGDSVESSDRPGAAPLCEPNSADNLMLFGGENVFPEVDRNLANPSRSSFTPSEQSSQLDVNHNAKELKDSAAFSLPRKAYRRRSRPNRDGARTGLSDAIVGRGGNGSSFSCLAPREVKVLVSDAEIQKDHNVSINCNSTSTSPDRGTDCKVLPSDTKLELDGVKAAESTADLANGLLAVAPDACNSENLLDDQHNQSADFRAQKSAAEIVSEGDESFYERQDVDSTGLESQPCVATEKVEDQACGSQMNGLSSTKGDRKSIRDDGQISSTVVGTKVLDSESSCAQTSFSLDGNNDGEMCTNLKNVDSNGTVKDQTSMPEETPVKEEASELVEGKKETQPDDGPVLNNKCHTVHQSRQENGFAIEPDEELKRSTLGLQNDVKEQSVVEAAEVDGAVGAGSGTEKNDDVPSRDNPIAKSETSPVVTHQGSIESSIPELPEATPSARDSTAAPEEQENNAKVASKADEDSIIEEARVIEAKHKRIAELSVATLPVEYCRKSHWDYVLEEMAWLANDFAQERLWKITAAAQICHRVASTSRLRFQEKNSHWEQKKGAHVLAKAVMEFWHSVEEASKVMEEMCPRKDSAAAIREYAMRYLKFNSSEIRHNQFEAPVTPERLSDSGIMDIAWEDHWTEENLFYTVPSGAMEAYRKLLESHGVQYEKTGSSIQEEAETSACDAVTDFGSQDNVYEEEGETSTYDCELSKSSRFAQRKRKKLTKGYGASTYEVGADSMYTQCLENKLGSQQSVLMGKQPASSLNVSIPTKRVRTAPRQRVLSPFTPGTSGCVQLPSKTDASSGDTSSFQDDQSTLHGGSHMPNSMEVESVGDFEKQLLFDSTEVSKPKKKKKAKHLVSAYEQRWPVDSHFQNEQREFSKKRSESHQLESNGSSGLFGQHVAKKPKMMRPTLDSSFDNIAPVAGSVPSPVASQMSNMSNPNKLIKILGGRERGRKAKALKVSAGQQGSGSPWSLFEDQALVVLVHDMGPNWELVSDAINSTLQFKCIYRKPKDCKDRHKILMDRTTSDGADSAEDSGSSQPYPSTLPGIPKGSARQLFQRLQGPMEEDTLKSHFEKIIIIERKQHYRKTQNDNHDPKQLQQPHSSHMLALSQVCPNNLNGGPVLTPLDLCDATTSSPDILSLGYQSSHSSGLAMSNQGTVAPMLPASGANPALQVSTNMVLPNNFSSPSALNISVRDGRYAVPRSVSSSIDEQHRMQQYNQMLSSRNMQQPNVSAPGAIPGTDRGVRMLPGGNGMGIMGGVNRSVPMARPGFQPMASSSMLNSGSMLSSGMVAMPSPVNMHSGPGPGQGNSIMRARDGLHMMRPSQNQEPQRQMMAPELQMQASQANSQGVTPYGGLSSSFPNQAASPPVSSYPLHHQQSHPVSSPQPHMLSPHHPHLQGANHSTSAQHQAYAIRLAKERQLQQRFLQQQQQQQQFAASSALMSHVQAQPQLPMSSPLQNSSQFQSQTSSPPVPFSPLTSSSPTTPVPQQQQKHQMPPHGHVRNSQTGGSGLTNQMGKQRRQPQQQQQQFQQAGRLHPQQRQQSQSQPQQQPKLVKGVGRGNTVMQQNNPIDPSLLNGVPTNLGNQSNERGEQAMRLMHGQGLHSGSASNPVQNAKHLVPPNSSNQSQPQQKMYPNQGVPASKHLQQMPSESDNSSQGHVAPVASSPNLSACQQSVAQPIAASSNHHQQPQQHPPLQTQSQHKLVNQNPPTSHVVPQLNRQVNIEQPNKLEARESQSERHSLNNSSHLSTAMPQAGNDTLNETQVISSCDSQWKASEPLYGVVTSTPTATGIPLTDAAVSKPIEGQGQRQFSGTLSSSGHEVNAEWQPPPQLQQPSSPASQQQQLPPAQHAQQQLPLVQAGNNSLYVKPGDSRME